MIAKPKNMADNKYAIVNISNKILTIAYFLLGDYMKKILIFIFLLFISITTIYAEELDLAPNATSAIMIEASTGEVLYEKNANERLAPASMTKMMSLLLIMEEIEKGNLSLDDIVTSSSNASSMGGSQIFLQPGEKMSVNDLLKGICIASGNDATVAMAEKIAGNESAFVKMMNDKAKELGLKNTNFINPTGLDADNHYSSALDMALIAKELVKHEKILEYSATYEDYLRKNTDNPFWLVNTNKLVKFYSGVDGLKTGYTSKAGYCLTATAKKDKMRLITVVMNEEDSSKRSSDTTNMLDYGYNNYIVRNIVDQNTSIDTKEVELGKERTVDIVASDTITLLNKKTDKVRNVTYKANIDKIIAPIKKGNKVGTIDILEDGKIISTIDATVSKDVDKVNIFTAFLRNLKKAWQANINF